MSTIEANIFAVRGARGTRRPGYLKLLPGVLGGQLVGGVMLYAVVALLAFSSLAGVSASNLSLYLPWTVDGVWSLAADLGWAALVLALVVPRVHAGVGRRAKEPPALEWTAVSVAVGGYGPLLLIHASGPGVAAVSILVTPLLLRALAYDRGGSARGYHVRLHRRSWLGLGAAIAVVILPFSLTHPFLAQGTQTFGGGPLRSATAGALSSARDIYSVEPGQVVQSGVGLRSGPLSSEITGVTLRGSGTPLRVEGLTLSTGDPGFSALGRHPQLPLELPAGRSLWITYAVALRSCSFPASSVDRVVLHYRVLGIGMSEVVPVQDATELACRASGAA
jgi:hypothetical protein